MKTVGKQLQDARVAKGWSPELAARETKIRLDRLRELEDDDYSNFSSPTYARGFVRTYARALGLDEYRVLRQLDNKLPEDDNATFINDTGVPYMPEPSQVTKPFQVGRGVYIAGGVGAAMLLIIGFILVQSYRAGYFAAVTPPPAALPVTATNALPVVPDSDTARALPADSNAAPVALPVDNPPAAVATPPPEAAPPAPAAPSPSTILADTNAAPRALPVDLNAMASDTNAAPAPAAPAAAAPDVSAAAPAAPATPVAPAAPATAAPPVVATAPAVATPAPAGDTAPAVTNAPTSSADMPASTVPTNTATPPRALPVDLNALAAAPATNAPAADAPATVPPTADPAPQPVASALSARDSNAGPGVHLAAAEKATQDLINATTPPVAPNPPVPTDTGAQPAAAPVALPVNQAAPDASAVAPPAADPSSVPSSLAPASGAEPQNNVAAPGAAPVAEPDPAATGTPPPANGSSASAAGPFQGKRLVLTASHDSFVRVIALDGPDGGQVRYSSTLKSGQSISFNDRKYSINVADASAVDIALDGVNYGPHSETSAPDTFTVESHTP
jgi:cytoskeletal protein RodZ